MYFSDSFYKSISWTLWKWPWVGAREYHWWYINTDSCNGLVTVRQQAITWAKVVPDLGYRRTSLGHNELTRRGTVIHKCQVTASHLVQAKACHLLSTESLPEPMLTNCQLPYTHFNDILLKIQAFSSRKCIWTYHLWFFSVGYFSTVNQCLNWSIQKVIYNTGWQKLHNII